jgi:prepilin-type processing-associated H-X9-DG protein
LRCNSDPTATGNGRVYNNVWAGTNYLANFNTFAIPFLNSIYALPVRFVQVTDGLSGTLLFGEGYSRCYGPHGGVERIALLGDYHHFGITPGTHLPDTYLFQQKPADGQCDQSRAQSGHNGGMNACFGDSSVRQVSATVSQAVWDALLLPNDGSSPDPSDWE